MCSDTMTSEEVRAVVEAAFASDDFPGYFLYCQVGICGVRSLYEWVDVAGVLWDRWSFELEWESILNQRGWDRGEDSVDSLIEDRAARGELFPLCYAD